MDDDGDQVLESTHAESALNTHAEASKMLEAALMQMDGIIAGKQFHFLKTNRHCAEWLSHFQAHSKS